MRTHMPSGALELRDYGNQCLDVPSGTLSAVYMQEHACNGGINQEFLFEERAPGQLAIHPASSATLDCIDEPSGSARAGLPLQQYGCNYGTNQQWIVNFAPPKTLGLSSANYNGECWDSSQTTLEQQPCTGYQPQQWVPAL